MKSARIVLVLLLVGGRDLANASNQGSEPVKPLPPRAQLVTDELQVVLTDKRPEFRDSAWPQDIDKIRVDRSRVPNEVLTTTSRWLTTMIKAKYLPKDPNDWLIPIRKAKPGFHKIDKAPDGTTRRTHIPEEGFDDYFGARYSVAGNSFQIQEGRGAVHLLIDVNEARLFNAKIEQFVTNALYEFLNYPEGQKGALRFSLDTFQHGGKTIWFGIVNCDFDIRDSGARARRAWWSHTFMWTDGRRVYFSLVKMSGEPKDAGRGSAKLGGRPRFK